MKKLKKEEKAQKETAQNLREEFGDYIVSELTIKKIKKLQDEGMKQSNHSRRH